MVRRPGDPPSPVVARDAREIMRLWPDEPAAIARPAAVAALGDGAGNDAVKAVWAAYLQRRATRRRRRP